MASALLNHALQGLNRARGIALGSQQLEAGVRPSGLSALGKSVPDERRVGSIARDA